MLYQDKYLSTDHFLSSLKGRTVSSAFVTLSTQAAQFTLNLSAVMVLARLLTPEDFGLVAMVTIIMGFLRVFNDAGLSTATIQRDGISHAQVSNLFWVNVVLGGTVTILLAAASPLVAWFYSEPRLLWITLALSISFLLTASAVQHTALLKRQMRFGILALVQLSSIGLGVAVGIGMAWLNYSYWSLVGMQISTTVFAFLSTLAASRWRPSLPSRNSGTRPLLSFGVNLSVSSILWSLSRGADGLLIGRFCGSAALGLYSRAGALLVRPVQELMSPIESVFLTALARVQAQPERYRRIFLKTYEVVALTSFMFTGLLFPLARPVTLVVLGPMWESAATILAAFALVALCYPFGSIATWLLTSQGRGREFLVLSSISSLITITSFLVGLPFGPAGVAFSYAASYLLFSLPAVYHIAGRSGPVTTRTLWLSFFQHLPLWFVVCMTTWMTRYAVSGYSSLLQLTVCLPVGLLAGVCFILTYPPSRRAAMNLLDTLREWKQEQRGKA